MWSDVFSFELNMLDGVGVKADCLKKDLGL